MKHNYDNLLASALKWWPDEIVQKAEITSAQGTLLSSHKKFIAVVASSKPNMVSVSKTIANSSLSINLFLKHLSVMADFGGEGLSRLGDHFAELFQNDKKGYYLEYKIGGKLTKYYFKQLPIKSLGNSALLLDKKFLKLTKIPTEKVDLITDVICILLFAGYSTNKLSAKMLKDFSFAKYLGKKAQLQQHLVMNYLRVSRIVGGGVANDKGQLLEEYIATTLKKNLPKTYTVLKKKIKIGKKTYPFDLIVTNPDKKGKNQFGVEISFQVTTNSTIERKGNEASSRYKALSAKDFYLGYVIDGAGNFKRKNAIEKLILHSDYVASIKEAELKKFAKFIKGKLC